MIPLEQGPLADRLAAALRADEARMRHMEICRAVLGADAWIGAGFLRNLIWDREFGDGGVVPLQDDIDVLYFDPADLSQDSETAFENRLIAAEPGTLWQVRNQARMHLKHGDRPYRDIRDAMSFWLETATAIAVRLHKVNAVQDRIEIISAYGLQDLFAGFLRPTAPDRVDRFLQRVQQKHWQGRWPGIRVLAEEPHE